MKTKSACAVLILSCGLLLAYSAAYDSQFGVLSSRSPTRIAFQQVSVKYPINLNQSMRLKGGVNVVVNLAVSGQLSTIDPFWETLPGKPLVLVAFNVQIKEASALGDIAKHNGFGLHAFAPESAEPVQFYSPPPIELIMAPTAGRTWGTLRGKEDLMIDLKESH